jgi:hypothetical protein
MVHGKERTLSSQSNYSGDLNMTKIYAGIGSRRTPADICELMQQLGRKLALKGATLRSGGADGADLAFEKGCDEGEGIKQIFYAKDWEEKRPQCAMKVRWKYIPSNWEAAQLIAAQHHPNWINLNLYPRKLHTRNCFQILGFNLHQPANFVLCWTPDGARTAEETSAATGGTGQAIRVASSHGIRVYNLAVLEDLELARSWVAQ